MRSSGPGNDAANVLFREPSTSMAVDLMTKALPVEVHWRCMRELGLGRFRDGPPGLDQELSTGTVPSADAAASSSGAGADAAFPGS